MSNSPSTFFWLLASLMVFNVPLMAEQAVESKKITKCDPIFKEVQTAVTAEPDKVLLIVEENVRASADCVCEIIKAAILATRANAELTRQIMLTALNTAPEKAKIIEICIAAIAAERSGQVKTSGKDVQEVRSGKEGKEVAPLLFSEKGVKEPLPLEPPPLVAGADDYYIIPRDIRGVYLIQPAAGGVYFAPPPVVTPPPDKDKPPPGRNPPPPPPPPIREYPPDESQPQSPSCGCIRPRNNP